MKNPIVSICIPTKNRCDALKQCIDSILYNIAYNPDDVEIVVSDNASTDNTQELMKLYTHSNNNIVYNRNQQNIGIGGGGNFLKVLSLAHGQYLKIHNDYSVFTDKGLKYLLDFIKQNMDKKPSLFFVHTSYDIFESQKFKTLDALLDNRKWGFSWLGSMGYWKTAFDNLEDKEVAIPTRFVQIDWYLRTFTHNQGCIMCSAPFTKRVSFMSKQGGYNFVEIHTKNFFGMFELYVNTGVISKRTMMHVKKDVLYSMLIWISKLLIRSGKYNYDNKNALKTIYSQYKHYYWFYTTIFFLPFIYINRRFFHL